MDIAHNISTQQLFRPIADTERKKDFKSVINYLKAQNIKRCKASLNTLIMY